MCLLKKEYLHLPEARFVVMAPGKARGCLLPFKRLLYLLSCEEHLNIHKILKHTREPTNHKLQRTNKGRCHVDCSKCTMPCVQMAIKNREPRCRSAWPVSQPCCSSHSAGGAPPSCGPCVSSSTGWLKLAGRCCAPSSARCDVCTIWHFHLLLEWTLRPVVCKHTRQ